MNINEAAEASWERDAVEKTANRFYPLRFVLPPCDPFAYDNVGTCLHSFVH